MARFPRVVVGPAGAGRGVFAGQLIGAGRRVLRFGGPVLDHQALRLALAETTHDGFLQVGPQRYLGPSGTADDLINHACSPNTFVQVGPRTVYLVALRDIEAGEELTFDYATTQVAFPLRFSCGCGAAECRGEIGNYDEMPLALITRYRALGALPWYVLEYLDKDVQQLAG